MRLCLEQLADPKLQCLKDPRELAAIGFKAVHAQGVTGVQRVDERVLAAMEAYADVAPAHNPPYVAAMRLLAQRAAARFRWWPRSRPASTRPSPPARAALRRAAGMGREARHPALGLPRRQPSLHRRADGPAAAASPRRRSSPATWAAAVRCVRSRTGKSVANSLGMSPQSGLPHNNRVGDFDPFALPALMRATGKTLEQVLDDLANRSGLLGLSG